MRTKRLLFALCSRARLCYPRLAGSGAAPRGDPPPVTLCPPQGPGGCQDGLCPSPPAGTTRGRGWDAAGSSSEGRGVQKASYRSRAAPREHSRGHFAGFGPKILPGFGFLFGSKKKKKRWMRCWGADHSPGSMVGRVGFGDPCRSLPYGTIL